MTIAPDKLQVNKVIAAPPNSVYEAWTDLERLKLWLSPEGMDVAGAEVDARVPGAYHVRIRGDGTSTTVSGKFRELVPSQRIVMTCRSDRPGAVETVVKVELRDREDGATELWLTQEGFRDVAEARTHFVGWTTAIDKLSKLLASEELECEAEIDEPEVGDISGATEFRNRPREIRCGPALF